MRKIKIGLLFSMTGSMSVTEKGQYQAAMVGINKINGDMKGKGIKFVPILKNTNSELEQTVNKTKILLREEKVDVIVGCWVSAYRKAILSILKENNGLLLYPSVYEGMESHPNVIYCGRIPNQQEAMIPWAMENLGHKFYLLGNDYIYPRYTIKQLTTKISKLNGIIVKERYVPMWCDDYGEIITELKGLGEIYPNIVIIPVLVGSNMIPFYQQYKKEGLGFPIISPVISEREILEIGRYAAADHYCASSYFQDIDTLQNKYFVDKHREIFGEGSISADMEATYNAICLIGKAYEQVELDGKDQVSSMDLREVLKGLTIDGPQGRVIVDPKTQHLWLWSRIGKIKRDGSIKTIWSYPGPLKPEPFEIEQLYEEDLSSIEKPYFENTSNIIIGKSKAIMKEIKRIEVAARTSANILITGESGTGKEVFARAIHEISNRKDKAFIPINCATIPKELMASVLFGYEEGTFTGSQKGGRKGLFQTAHEGTIFLDEITEMSFESQAILLRVLQEKEIYPLGSNLPIPIDVRVIAATNRESLAGNHLREDLYYRLNVFNVKLPPLRERIEDISLLVEYKLKELNSGHNTSKKMNSMTLERLLEYNYPGNVRELFNIIEYAFHMALDSLIILPCHLPDRIKKILLSDNKENIEKDSDLEKSQIKEALAISNGNIVRAAEILGFSRSTMYRRINSMEIEVDNYR